LQRRLEGMEADVTRVARGSAYLVTQSLITMLIGTVGFAFVARILTQAEMGVSVVLTLILGFALLVSDLGFSSGLTKYVAEYRGKGTDYTRMSFAGILAKALIAGSTAVICGVMAPILSEGLLKSTQYTFIFRLFSIDILFACINTTMTSLLIGMDRIKEVAILSTASAFARYALIVSLLLFGFGLTGFVTGGIIGDSIYLVSSISLMIKTRSVELCSIRETIPYLKKLAKFSWPLFTTNIVTFLYNWFDRALLLAYTPLAEVAVYSVAYTAFTALYAIPTALATTLFPYFATQYGKNQHENIAAGVRTSTRYIALLYVPLALGLTITSNAAITFFAGQAYERGDTVLAALSIFGGISGIGAALGPLLLVFEMTPVVLLINVCSVGVSSALSFLLLPSLGINGIAIVRGVSMIVSLALTVFFLRKRLPIQLDKEATWKSWSAAIVMLVAVGLFERSYSDESLLLLYVLIGGVVYVASLRILKAVNKDDIQLIRSLIGPRAAFIVKIIERILTQ
jgi:O-antigen/teichoic acid export membrane protein